MTDIRDKVLGCLRKQGVNIKAAFCNRCNVEVTDEVTKFCWNCGNPEYRWESITVSVEEYNERRKASPNLYGASSRNTK